MDFERVLCVMRIWDVVIKCLDEILFLLDVSIRYLMCDLIKGMDGEVFIEFYFFLLLVRFSVWDLFFEY